LSPIWHRSCGRQTSSESESTKLHLVSPGTSRRSTQSALSNSTKILAPVVQAVAVLVVNLRQHKYSLSLRLLDACASTPPALFVAGCRPMDRGVPLFRLVSVILRITVQPVLLQYLRTVVDSPRNYERPRCGLGPAASGQRSRQRGRTCGLPSPRAHQRVKAMKHDLTLDHVKKEARDLLRGLERRDPEALRRCHAIEPLTDLSNTNLLYTTRGS